MINEKLSSELKRKGLHILAVFLPLSIFLFQDWQISTILVVPTVIAVSLDLIRLKSKSLSKFYVFVLGKILRKHEMKGNFTGATFFFLSLTISYFVFHRIFDKPIDVIIGVYVAFMLADAAAALIGKFLGKIKIYKTKTLEGFLSCFLVAFLMLFIIVKQPILYLGLFAFLISVIELIVDKLDDNFVVPILSLSIISFFV